MSDRVDRVIAKIRALHLAAEQRGVEGVETECDEKERRRRAEAADVLVVSHGHFSRCFIARWIGLPLTVGTVSWAEGSAGRVWGEGRALSAES